METLVDPEVSIVRPVTLKNLFANVDAHPVVLDFALLRAFKMEWLSWLPETLFSEIEQTFQSSVAEVNKTKIMATQTLHVTDAFWEQWEIFEKTVMAMNGIVPRLSVMQPPDVAQILAALDVVKQIRVEKFSEEVARYTAACFLHDQVHYAPELASFAQEYISQPMYRCKDCSKVAPANKPFDGMCDSCAGRFDHEHSLSFKPDPAKLARGVGKNLELFELYESDPVKQRFEELGRTTPEQMQIAETDTDLQAAKLIVAEDYMRLKHKQMLDQLSLLRPWLEAS